jgi:heme o synthase
MAPLIQLRQLVAKKASHYAQLIKIRLSLLVVFSAAMAYLWTTDRNVDAVTIWLLSVGGFFITGSANILNQIIEKKPDRLMKRTAERPLASGRMEVREAGFLALVLGVSGLFLLFKINTLCALLGLIAMFSYTCVYTPMKKVSWLSILPGAIAGSLPVVIGSVAAAGIITTEAMVLFLLQFIWQFPHTWSIAWLLNDDYQRAGFRMLPVLKKDKMSAAIILMSTFLIIPSGLLLNMYGSSGVYVTWILVLAGLIMLLFAYRLFRLRTDHSALGLMFSCFTYLPFVLIILVAEKFL